MFVGARSVSKVILTAQPKDTCWKTAIACDVVTSDSSKKRSGVYMLVCIGDSLGKEASPTHQEPIPTGFRFTQD